MEEKAAPLTKCSQATRSNSLSPRFQSWGLKSLFKLTKLRQADATLLEGPSLQINGRQLFQNERSPRTSQG